MNFAKVKKVISEQMNPKGVCCFCGEPIEGSALINIKLDLGDNQSQAMFAHGLCLKERLHSSVPFLAPEEMDE